MTFPWHERAAFTAAVLAADAAVFGGLAVFFGAANWLTMIAVAIISGYAAYNAWNRLAEIARCLGRAKR